MKLIDTLAISGAGLKVQSDRLRVVAQNVANANATGATPNEDPYRRKVISFDTVMDRQRGIELIKTKRIETAPGAFPLRYDPSHPAANKDGYVRVSNVNPMIEMMDMREARRAYEANLNMIEASRQMLQQAVNLLR
jgi:flagellar basal-body rod protein FlgC